jgi:hypothetical protein
MTRLGGRAHRRAPRASRRAAATGQVRLTYSYDRPQTARPAISANGLLGKRAQRPFGGPPQDLLSRCLKPTSTQRLREIDGTRQKRAKPPDSALQAGCHRFDPGTLHLRKARLGGLFVFSGGRRFKAWAALWAAIAPRPARGMLGRPSGPRRGGPDDLHLQARAGRRDAGRAAVGPDAVPNWRVGDTIPSGANGRCA